MIVHPIEAESYQIIDSLLSKNQTFLQLSLPEQTVIKRVLHATGNIDFVDDFVFREGAIDRAQTLLSTNSPVITDVKMTYAGINYQNKHCFIDQVNSEGFPTRSALGLRKAVKTLEGNFIAVIGCAPTAIEELLTEGYEKILRTCVIIGVPVGFVGAAEQKIRLREKDILSITNKSQLGGSAVAAAILNALVKLTQS
jgi:precorrin-8X/cobalt-precorrin-8 methylmutase